MAGETRYREVAVAGSPRLMGRQIGEAARDEIRGFCEVALERVNLTTRVSRASALEVVRGTMPFAEGYAPDLVDELRGMAEAAGVPLEDLMLLQVRNQLQADAEAGCTSLSLSDAEGGALVAQNWDSDPELDRFTIVLTRKGEGRPAITTVTQAGLIAYIGFSESGFGACLNTLPAPARRVGVPHYFTLRRIYESRTVDEAVAAVRGARRAIPANIMLATPDGPANLEVTLEHVHVQRPRRTNGLAHTNHCLHPELTEINDRFPELIQSHSRKRRIDQLLALALESDRRVTLEDVKNALRDHEGHPRSICRHTNDDPGTGHWQTVFSVILEPQQRCMHVSRGTPCTQPYETYAMPE
ncbi:MAG: C45 family peptidase [Planctomycetes bacterium]|nr:C45 family peptidase [Planctomycetota bacterium]